MNTAIECPQVDPPSWPWPDGAPLPTDIIDAFGEAYGLNVDMKFVVEEEAHHVMAVDLTHNTAGNALTGEDDDHQAEISRLVAKLLNLANCMWSVERAKKQVKLKQDIASIEAKQRARYQKTDDQDED